MATQGINAILVLEDRPRSMTWLCAAAAQAFPAARLLQATTLAEAGALSASALDMAIVDLELPDGSGVELIRALAAAQPDCQCVVATLFDDDGHLFEALRAGAHGYVLKDLSHPELAALLRGAAAGQPALSPGIARRVLTTFRSPEPPASAPTEPLTAREGEVLAQIAGGQPLAEAAEALGMRRSTAAYHVRNIYQKLRISNRAQAVHAAARLGIQAVAVAETGPGQGSDPG